MEGPLETMMKSVMKKNMEEAYPQVQFPAVMKAKVTKAVPLAEEYYFDDLEIEDKSESRSYEAKITGKWFEYSLKILNKDGTNDSEYPVIPGVKSMVQVKTGATVAVALLYGELSPFILGEAR
ncbi:MAG: hypothetical protein LBQ71_12445 [Hungatella sp.]|jgi:hypothetical protein|nr:hypothetical protein [Hungatella sp.]